MTLQKNQDAGLVVKNQETNISYLMGALRVGLVCRVGKMHRVSSMMGYWVFISGLAACVDESKSCCDGYQHSFRNLC